MLNDPQPMTATYNNNNNNNIFKYQTPNTANNKDQMACMHVPSYPNKNIIHSSEYRINITLSSMNINSIVFVKCFMKFQFLLQKFHGLLASVFRFVSRISLLIYMHVCSVRCQISHMCNWRRQNCFVSFHFHFTFFFSVFGMGYDLGLRHRFVHFVLNKYTISPCQLQQMKTFEYI